MSLTQVDWPGFLDTSSNDLVKDFFEPALSRSIRYDRGVGYFTSGWLRANSEGMVQFASNGGKARWITSPILDREDWQALIRGDEAMREPLLKRVLEVTVQDLATTLQENTREALAWMVADGIIDFKLAVPANDLDGGEFHDKFGICTDANGRRISFNGSYNDSLKGLRNYESLKVFVSWREETAPYVEADAKRFERLWDNQDPNVRVFSLPEAARSDIVKLRKGARPYRFQGFAEQNPPTSGNDLWPHQQQALEEFLQRRCGVVEMATGTGKTRLALAICDRLLSAGDVSTIIVAADGTDLLDQWYTNLLELIKSKVPRWAVHRQYAHYKGRDDFSIDPQRSILLTSREFLDSALRNLEPDIRSKTILIHDEVHRLGSPANREALRGLGVGISYKLGLSATPEREYDADGNDFIETEIGPIIFRFGLEDAIRNRILAPFEYHPLSYMPSAADTARVQAVYAKEALRKKEGRPMTKEEVWTEIARVYKTSKEKLAPFREFVSQQLDILVRCIVFVETREYGDEVLEIIHGFQHEFHTYYADEDSVTLERFAEGELECLITCHRLSEGIDIRSLASVVLFSSSRAKLETIQRIGRCLRIDPNNPGKLAHVIDFIRMDSMDTPDWERSQWLGSLAAIRP